MELQPYLFFDGRAEEAFKFYQKAVGAELVMMVRFKDAPPSADVPKMPPEMADKVMHMRFKIGNGIVLASDGRCLGKPEFKGVTLTLTVRDVPEAERLYNALSDGGHVQMAFTKTFFSPGFGMVADRFGVSWMVTVEK
jgi:PhnB protein